MESQFAECVSEWIVRGEDELSQCASALCDDECNVLGRKRRDEGSVRWNGRMRG